MIIYILLIIVLFCIISKKHNSIIKTVKSKNNRYINTDKITNSFSRLHHINNKRLKRKCVEEFESNVTKERAITVFIPDNDKYYREFKNLYTCYKYIGIDNDTDIIVFCPSNNILNKLPHDVIKIKYRDVNENDEWYNDIYKGKYLFVNSFIFLTDIKYYSLFRQYKYILKTDTDIFLTPKFKTFFPGDKMYTGTGQYVHETYTRNRLKHVAKKLNLNHHNIFNVGATWYGKSSDIIDFAKLSVIATKYIYFNEFKGINEWPKWHMGVASMYGSELAANHLFHDKLIKTNKIDADSTSDDNLDTVFHVHCWHSNGKVYSKFDFEKHRYKNMNIPSNPTKINDYCLFISKKA
jgi:hypothetical protein